MCTLLTLPCLASQPKNAKYIETEVELDSLGFAIASDMAARAGVMPPADRKMIFRSRVIDSDKVVFKEVNNSMPAKLADAIGENINEIDSLVVKGVINQADLKTLWSASFYGRMTVLNLEDCYISENVIPDYAFWDHKVQLSDDGCYVYPIALQHIILPKQLDRIGKFAFYSALNLTTVDFPAHLREIDNCAFHDCKKLSNNPLIIPEGVERIGDAAFTYCYGLTGSTLVLPSTITNIDFYAFQGTRLKKVEFAEMDPYDSSHTLSIGESAFCYCEIKELELPWQAYSFSGANQFAENYRLEKLVIPSGYSSLPESCFQNCMELKEVVLGEYLIAIEKSCFDYCIELDHITLPYSIEVIGERAFIGCSMKSITLPPRMEYLEANSLAMKSLESIYSMRDTPPLCYSGDANATPFGPYTNPIVNKDIPIYVPVGAAEKYRAAKGWDYFTNFIETNDFPTSIPQIPTPGNEGDNTLYDLSGKRVTAPAAGNIYLRNHKKVIYTGE